SQTEMMVAALRAAHPDLQIDVRQIQTQGDKDQTTSLARIGGQGVFVKELEKALLAGEVDAVVHSLKDMPADIPQGLTLAATPERG
ncbi:MAG: hydroxymethylbilane synthase, partial [Acidobacteria bacterium]|nr:hydroxymethylbilane synthase [Acidobacteriota bacterium]NIQ87465.1 hydroxymethylbilane synthase [Acidobacteriota bacterium]